MNTVAVERANKEDNMDPNELQDMEYVPEWVTQ